MNASKGFSLSVRVSLDLFQPAMNQWSLEAPYSSRSDHNSSCTAAKNTVPVITYGVLLILGKFSTIQVAAVVLVQPDEQQCTSLVQPLFLAVHTRVMCDTVGGGKVLK